MYQDNHAPTSPFLHRTSQQDPRKIPLINSSFPAKQGENLLSQAISGFLLRLHAAGRAANTIESYTRILDWLQASIGNQSLEEITDTQLQLAVLQRASEPGGQIRWSASTVNTTRTVIKAFFNWCQDSGRISTNPGSQLMMEHAEPCRTIPIAPAEVRTLLDCIRGSGTPLALRDEALLATYAMTGIRRSEALALRVRDYLVADRRLFLPLVKGGGSKFQMVPKQLAEILDRYLRSNSGPKNPDAPLFPGRSPEHPLSAREADNRFTMWKEKAGLQRQLTIHSFRAGLATLLHEVTADPFLVASALGHRDLATTRRYVTMELEQVRAAVESALARSM